MVPAHIYRESKVVDSSASLSSSFLNFLDMVSSSELLQLLPLPRAHSPISLHSRNTTFLSDPNALPVIPLSSSHASSTVSPVKKDCEMALDHDYDAVEESFGHLTRYLGTTVILSTFMTTVVMSFLALAHNIIQDRDKREFQIAMMLCLLTATCHLFIILIAGRACIQVCWYSRIPNTRRPSLEEYQNRLYSFYRCLKISEWVQGLGQVLFPPAILYTVWQMFSHHIYPVVIISFVAVLEIIVYAMGYWNISWISMTLKSIKHAFRHFQGPPR